jgi:tripartite-type tricarboxylate transporter receptor subunit TctC
MQAGNDNYQKETSMTVEPIRRIAAGFALALAAAGACAAGYPDHPIRVIVPFPAGAATDGMARIVAARLQAVLGQPLIVENRGGASGMIGAEYVAKAAPDGYTLLYTASGPIATSLKLYDNVPYDASRAFAPISLVIANTVVLIARANTPYQDLKGLVAYVKASPGKVKYGYGPAGGLSHLLMALFARGNGLDMTFVPYKGEAPVMIDLLSGTLAVTNANLTSYLSYLQNGKVKALAVASPVRSPLLPNVPTFKELGYPDMVAETWSALLAPAGTPAAVITRLNQEIHKIQLDPSFAAEVTRQAAVIKMSTPEQARSFIQSEADKWSKVIVDNGIKLN